MISTRQVHCRARMLQSRATAINALFVTLFLLFIEHVRAFAGQYHISAHDAMVLASAASSLTRKLSSTCVISGGALRSTLPKTASLCTSPRKANGESSTRLNAWSIPTIAMPSISMMMPTREDIPLHTLGSWYTEVDPTIKPPVYDDEYDNSYSFSSPTDDWPSMSTDMDTSSTPVQSHIRRGPLKTIRRLPGRFKDIFVQ